ncbi:MAG TPA: ABC transporter ATP-binding protein [Fibrobacteria bacterium]|nr:ABC transporter ATP-binding protein [Fibrobacteria bacterium]
MEPSVVEASRLAVSFPGKRGAVEALRGLDFHLPRGSLLILLGPNGAGKTTFMRCITGLVRPTSGSLRVLGSLVAGEGREDRLRRIGVLIENPGVYGRLDAREYLSFFAGFYGSAGAARDWDARIDALCGAFGLGLDSKPVAKLSQGNRQKLHLARSLLHAPELLLWDEPTDHLDPEAQGRVLGYLRSYVEGTGATALVATHRLEQMEAVGTHFGFLREGRLAASGTRAELLSGAAERVRVVLAEDGAGPAESASRPGTAVAAAVRDLGLSAGRDGAGAWTVSGPDLDAKIPSLVRALVGAGLAVRAVEPLRPGLAETYARVMGSQP